MTPQQVASAQGRARAWQSGATAEVPKTADVPRAAAPSPPAGPPPVHAIREAQGLMAALGYRPGSSDGRWGPRTSRAYAAFLRDAGLPPGDDVLTPDALRAMRAAAKERNVAATMAPSRQAPATQRKAARPPVNLHQLVAAGDVDGLKAALAKGVDANARDGKGWTALMLAADKGQKLLAPLLLMAGADPDLRLADGATALFIAAVHGHTEIITLLMEAGAQVALKGPKGKTAAAAARTRYGDRRAAKKAGEPDSVIALLEGKTLKDYLEAPPVPVCAENMAPACWMEVSNQPKCYIWKSRDLSSLTKLDLTKLTLSWSGSCNHGKASGKGTLKLSYEWSGSRYTSPEKGEFRNGKKHGHWVEEGNHEGPYVDGKKHGNWVEDNHKGPYVHGKKHGHWVERDSVGDMHYEGSYVDGKKHGDWVERHRIGSTHNENEGPYVKGKKHGYWVEREKKNKARGGYTSTEKGPYKDGKKEGQWVERYLSSQNAKNTWTVTRSYVGDEQVGPQVTRYDDGRCYIVYMDRPASKC